MMSFIRIKNKINEQTIPSNTLLISSWHINKTKMNSHEKKTATKLVAELYVAIIDG